MLTVEEREDDRTPILIQAVLDKVGVQLNRVTFTRGSVITYTKFGEYDSEGKPKLHKISIKPGVGVAFVKIDGTPISLGLKLKWPDEAVGNFIERLCGQIESINACSRTWVDKRMVCGEVINPQIHRRVIG